MSAVLQIVPMPVPPGYRPPAGLAVETAFDKPDLDAWLREQGAKVRAVVTHSFVGVPPHLWEKLPALELVANFGVGLDLIDRREAARRNVQVTYTPDLLTHDVADLAITYVLALSRRLMAANEFVRSGAWPTGPFAPGRSTRGRKLGILGLGRIGNAIARRAAAFEMQLAYHGRSRKPSPLQYFDSPIELARWADVLIAAVPGGEETRHLVNRDVLRALGKDGLFINVARGSVVDGQALVEALRAGDIAGAGLDVFDGQPIDGTAYAGLANVILSPHIGSLTTDTRIAMAESVFANVRALLAGEPLHDLAPSL